MIVVNFSHPLTEDQRATIERLAKARITRVIDVPVHFDHERPFGDQVDRLVGQVGLSAADWQTSSVLINPPSFAPGAVALLAYLHGVIGHFPPIIRIRPVPDDVAQAYETAELIALQQVREKGRASR